MVIFAQIFNPTEDMLEQLEAIRERFLEVEQQIAMPEVVSDLKKFKTLSKEYKDLQKIVDQYITYQNLLKSIDEAKSVIATEKDEDFRDMAKAELEELVPQEKEMQEVLKELLIPRDPNDSKDCILEIRGGTGGDEASIFAGDLFRMYSRFCERHGFKLELIDSSVIGIGGFKEVIFEVTGEDVYGTLKYEAGVHRVQRVPQTETQGDRHLKKATADDLLDGAHPTRVCSTQHPRHSPHPPPPTRPPPSRGLGCKPPHPLGLSQCWPSLKLRA